MAQSQEWYKNHYLQQLENGELDPEELAVSLEDADQPIWADDELIQGAVDAHAEYQANQ